MRLESCAWNKEDDFPLMSLIFKTVQEGILDYYNFLNGVFQKETQLSKYIRLV